MKIFPLSKHSQGEVITVVMIIMVILVSGFIVTSLVINTINNQKGQIHGEVFAITLDSPSKPISNEFMVQVKVHRGSGKGNLNSIKFLLKDDKGNFYNYNSTNIPGELETKTYNISYADIGLSSGKIIQVQFFPILNDSNNKQIIGIPSPELKIGSGSASLPTCLEDTKICNSPTTYQICHSNLWELPVTCAANIPDCDEGNCVSHIVCNDSDRDGYDNCFPGYGINEDGKAVDCNDGRNDINPNITEVCDNSVDEDCDGYDAPCCYDSDGDGYDTCNPPWGNDTNYADCNDGDASSYPGSSCSDGNFCTGGDAYNNSCSCVGTSINSCSSGDGCCPTGCVYSNDNDCTCSNSCGDNSCGQLNECGARCLNCPLGQICQNNQESYSCVCNSDCTGKGCGEGNGCGGYCSGFCNYGNCISNGMGGYYCECNPDCAAKNCGDSNGCGGYCSGYCPEGSCSSNGNGGYYCM